MRGIVRSLALVAAVSTLSCAKGMGCQRDKPPAPVELDPGVGLQSSLAQQRAALAAAYRLGPDARFVRACGHAYRIASGAEKPTTVEASPTDFKVLVDGKEVGRLADLAPWRQGLELVASCARAGGAAGGPAATIKAAAGAFELPTPPVAFQWLRDAQARWATAHDAASLGKAARALVALSVQSFDPMEVGDDLDGRALALLVLAKGSETDVAHEEALLAERLGYRRAAVGAAESLPAEDDVRAWILRDDARLAVAAKKAGGTRAARWFWAKRLLERGDAKAETLFRRERMSDEQRTVALIGLRLSHARFMLDRTVAPLLPVFVMLEAAEERGDPRAKKVRASLGADGAELDDAGLAAAARRVGEGLELKGDLLDRFERDLGKAGGLSGPFYSIAVADTYHRSAFYGGLYRYGLHALDAWSSLEASRAFLGALGNGGGKVGDDFRSWLGVLVASRSGEAAKGELLARFKALPSFGAPPVLKVFHELMRVMDWGDQGALTAAKRLSARLDARPTHRAEFLEVSYEGLVDLPLTEKLARALVADGATGHGYGVSWSMRFLGEHEKLRARLDDAEVSPSEATEIAGWLAKAGVLTDAAATEHVRALLAKDPRSHALSDALADRLEKAGAFEDARRVLEQWLATNPEPSPAIDATLADIARLLGKEGKAEAGVKLLEPHRAGVQGDLLHELALLLDQTGHPDEAEDVAKEALARYGRVRVAADMAELLWRHGRHEAAARLIGARKDRLTDVREVYGKAFNRAFPGSETKAAVEAFKALQAKTAVDAQQQIVFAVNGAGRKELAVELSRLLRFTDPRGIDNIIFQYSVMKTTKGPTEALAWVRPQIPPAQAGWLDPLAFGRRCDELLWALVPPPPAKEKSSNSDNFWLFRAAVSLRTKDDPHRTEIEKHYEAPVVNHYDALGRFFMGKGTEEEVLARVKHPRAAAEVAYWLGYKAERDGRRVDASDWYRTSVESGQSQVWEMREAYDRLAAFTRAGKVLAQLDLESP